MIARGKADVGDLEVKKKENFYEKNKRKSFEELRNENRLMTNCNAIEFASVILKAFLRFVACWRV
jgi:hypothetical protein